MKKARHYLRWFFTGMGSVMGISQVMPAARTDVTEVEAIGGDFRVIGGDLRVVIKRHPASAESAR
ncbi:MAG: hypothetical protein M3505_02955, partial [Verrucomicrobiota bacterium]|nr:hypothetical protein [Verrucomicrobiota bacterium]